MHTLQADFTQITVGTPATLRNLTLFPPLRPELARAEPGYLLVADVLAQGLTTITELAGGGSVPELRLETTRRTPFYSSTERSCSAPSKIARSI